MEIVDCGSFYKAAYRLFISPQALRASMNSLEKNLGFKLFVRTSSGVDLTPEGAAIVQDMRTILTIEKKWEVFKGSPDQVSGTAYIATTQLGSDIILYDIILACRERYPNLVIKPNIVPVDGILEALGRQKMIGIMMSIPLADVENTVKGFAQLKEYEYELIHEDRAEIFMNANNPLARQSALRKEQLGSIQLVTCPDLNICSAYREIYTCFSSNPPIVFQDQTSILRNLEGSLCAGTVYPRILEHTSGFKTGRIAHLPVSDYPMPDVRCLLYPRWKSLNRGEKVLIEMVKEQLSEMFRAG